MPDAPQKTKKIVNILCRMHPGKQKFGSKPFKTIVNKQCFLLSIFTPTFWEDTDRGNFNIYFAPEKDQIEPFKELLFSLMDKRLEELERNVQFLSLEVDKLMQKRQRQDGYLNDVDKDRMEDLQRKIAARQKSEDETSRDWTIDHDLLYTLLCISFFADQEIDESEKNVIFNIYLENLIFLESVPHRTRRTAAANPAGAAAQILWPK